MAPAASLYSYCFNENAFDKAMVKAYNDAGIFLSNHSYGYFYKVYLGVYNTDAMAIDKAVSENPYLLAVMASGNDRDKSYYPRYGITKGPVNAKNILTIGAIDDTGEVLAAFSSTGPVLDGRIKPDLVANGTSLYSTGARSDDDYFYLSGTSMATPVTTGTIALLREAYSKLTTQDIRADLVKAILVNTATDKGRKGPDYEYGFGLIDAQAAVDLMYSLKQNKRAADEYARYAQYTLGKNKNINNIRLPEKTLFKVKTMTAKLGIPYQTYLTSIIHQTVNL